MKLKFSDKQKMDKLFFWFEDNLFQNDGPHHRSLNLVFEFADWIDSPHGAEKIEEYWDWWNDDDKIQEIRDEFSRGINLWLENLRR